MPSCWWAAWCRRVPEKRFCGRRPCLRVLPDDWARFWAVSAVGRQMENRWCSRRGRTCTWRTAMGLRRTFLWRPQVTPLPPTFLPTETGFAFRYRTRRTRTPYGRSARTDPICIHCLRDGILHPANVAAVGRRMDATPALKEAPTTLRSRTPPASFAELPPHLPN